MQETKDYISVVRMRLMDRLEYLDNQSDEQLQTLIGEELKLISEEYHLPLRERINLSRQIFHSMRRLDVLEDYIGDKEVTEIMVNGPGDIFVEKKGRLFKAASTFASGEALDNVIQQIVARCNRVVNESSPIVDARLQDGSRVNVVLPPIALNGPILTIRRFPEKPLLMEDLIRIGSVTDEAVALMRKLVISGYNIIISGGTGSGKTTFLNALSGFIPKDERIITIEDSAELQIQGIDNLVRLETRNANTEATKPISIRDLIRTSLRMRPNRIVVGECRGEEAMDMICSAMNCGHDGSMSTVHANSAADTLSRLETMILMAVELPIGAIRQQISGGVDIIIHLGRLRDKSRRVLEITEIEGYRDGIIRLHPLYNFVEEGEEGGRIRGTLRKVGEILNDHKLKAAGYR